MTSETPPETALPPVPLTVEGASVLHQMMRFRRAAWRALPAGERAGILEEAAAALGAMERPSDGRQSALYSLLGHKGDLMLVHFRRGFEEVNRAGQVEIRSEVREGKLRIEIHDDLPRRREGEEGLLDDDLGLANAKARLQHLYGASHYFALALEAGGGSRLTLEVPLIMQKEQDSDCTTFAMPSR